jgi:hypothetical protein
LWLGVDALGINVYEKDDLMPCNDFSNSAAFSAPKLTALIGTASTTCFRYFDFDRQLKEGFG